MRLNMSKQLRDEKDADELSLVGRNGATVMFDRERTLKLTLGGMDRIEQKFAADGRIVSVQGLLIGWVPTDRLKFILLEMLNGGREKGAQPVKEDDLEAIYDGYIENTGHREDLAKLMMDVYLAATKNPIKFRKEKIQETKEAKVKEKAPPGLGGKQ
jgi:hypothetical protein